VTALSDIPIQEKMLIAAVGPWCCRHREEMIYTCTYSEMRILQLIVSGTLANAGRPERVINKQTPTIYIFYYDREILVDPCLLEVPPISNLELFRLVLQLAVN
jgi:hypothetical protein